MTARVLGSLNATRREEDEANCERRTADSARNKI